VDRYFVWWSTVLSIDSHTKTGSLKKSTVFICISAHFFNVDPQFFPLKSTKISLIHHFVVKIHKYFVDQFFLRGIKVKVLYTSDQGITGKMKILLNVEGALKCASAKRRQSVTWKADRATYPGKNHDNDQVNNGSSDGRENFGMFPKKVTTSTIMKHHH